MCMPVFHLTRKRHGTGERNHDAAFDMVPGVNTVGKRISRNNVWIRQTVEYEITDFFILPKINSEAAAQVWNHCCVSSQRKSVQVKFKRNNLQVNSAKNRCSILICKIDVLHRCIIVIKGCACAEIEILAKKMIVANCSSKLI